MAEKPNFARASRAARKLLREHGISSPPIDPEQIAEEMGVNVVYARFKPPYNKEISGFFRLKDNAIVVNRDIPENRITFTIAHELAHKILHEKYIKSNDYKPMPRRDFYGGKKPKTETEADTFAANLLVPLPMLKRYADFADTDELAKMFFVSREVIENRLDLLDRHPELAR